MSDYTNAMSSRSLRALVIAWLATGTAGAQAPQSAQAESGKYRLYKFEQAIGEETYRIERTAGSVLLTDKFLFTDRGTPVPLETTFRAAGDLTPQSFESKGKGSRLSNIDVATRFDGAGGPKQFFAINGYSPLAQQMLMLRYWRAHGSPADLPVLPQGSTVRIVSRATESVTVNGSPVTLTRYLVSGVIWGREVLW